MHYKSPLFCFILVIRVVPYFLDDHNVLMYLYQRLLIALNILVTRQNVTFKIEIEMGPVPIQAKCTHRLGWFYFESFYIFTQNSLKL